MARLGGVILLALGPTYGIFLNALIYLPMMLWLWKAPYRIGVFLMLSLGMRAFSGGTVGLGGSFMGVHWSLAASAALVFVAIVALRAAIR